MNNLARDKFYQKVAEYFDYDAPGYAKQYSHNHVLPRLRHCFRWETEQFPWKKALEIGCGPGFDLVYWAQRYPQKTVWGIDVAPKMIAEACHRIQQSSIKNAKALIGTPEEMPKLFPGETFDLIYVYYGAFNTLADRKTVADILKHHLHSQGKLIITSINRWYIADMMLNFLLLRWKKSLARATGWWTGYSNKRRLPSQCISKKDIKNGFGRYFKLIDYKSYCIFYPPWYRQQLIGEKGVLGHLLWEADELLRKTPLRNCGEYSLYILQPR